MIRKYIIIPVSAVLSLMSCGVYRHYERPDVETGNSYTGHNPADTTTIADKPWRELFTDPCLQKLMELALARNTDLRVAYLKTNEAKAVVQNAKFAYLPSVNLAGAAGWTNNGGGIVLNPGQWLLNAIGSLTLPLFSRGTNIANLKIAKARQEEAALLFQNTRHNTPLPRSWRRIVIQSAAKLAKHPHSVERQTSFGYSVNNRT